MSAVTSLSMKKLTLIVSVERCLIFVRLCDGKFFPEIEAQKEGS